MPRHSRWSNVSFENLEIILRITNILLAIIGLDDFRYNCRPFSIKFSHHHPETRCNLAHRIAEDDVLWEKLPEHLPIKVRTVQEQHLFSSQWTHIGDREIRKKYARAGLRKLLAECL